MIITGSIIRQVYAESRNEPAGGAAYLIFPLQVTEFLLQFLVGIHTAQRD